MLELYLENPPTWHTWHYFVWFWLCYTPEVVVVSEWAVASDLLSSNGCKIIVGDFASSVE